LLFSSIPFLFYFLPAVLILYFAVPFKLKNAVLLLFSLLFYAWGEPRYVFLMLFTVLAAYIMARLTEKYRARAKLFTAIAVCIELAALLCFKYADFFIGNFNAATGLSLPFLRLALPVGISFYTFQILSYNVDVYRGTVPAQRSFIDLAAYVALFPQLIAGPIVRYSDIAAQLSCRSHSFDKAAEGIRRFIVGLSKKILIANSLGELCAVYAAAGERSVLFYWLYALGFSLQIYFDFSGYSDMAIGLGKILGFDFLENFNYPYMSRSITEFWRRWHISLGSWFRDYVYIPLGGNRVSRIKWFRNIFVVWFLTGFWHGAAWNFIAWGLYFGILLVLEKFFLLKKLERAPALGHIYVVLLVIFGFVIFDAAGMGEAIGCIGGMFGAGGIPLYGKESLYYLDSYALTLIIAVIGASPVLKNLLDTLRGRKASGRVLSLLEPVVLAGLFLLCTAYLVDGSFNPFLYFRF